MHGKTPTLPCERKNATEVLPIEVTVQMETGTSSVKVVIVMLECSGDKQYPFPNDGPICFCIIFFCGKKSHMEVVCLLLDVISLFQVI